MINCILEEQRRKGKIKKYGKDGQVTLVDPNELNPRAIGLNYLEEVKAITSLIERKPPPTPEDKEQKIHDYALDQKEFYNKRHSITNWRRIIADHKLTPTARQRQL